MSYGTVTVTSSPTKILSSPGMGSRKDGMVTNVSTTAVYLGFDSTVTTVTGFPLNQYDVWETNEPRCYQGELWGVTASSTSDIRYEEVL